MGQIRNNWWKIYWWVGPRDGITGEAKTGVIAQFKQYDAVTARTENK